MFIPLMERDASTPGPVTYRRGAETVDLTGKCWPGRWVVTEVPQEGGGYVTYGDRDLMIPAARLITASGDRFEPEEGHRITELIDGTLWNFDVLPPAGEPAQRWMDTDQLVYRVHLKGQKA